MNRLPQAYVAPPAVRELRELVRHRAKLVAVRSGLKAGVQAQHRDESEVVDVGREPGGGDQGFELQVSESEGG